MRSALHPLWLFVLIAVSRATATPNSPDDCNQTADHPVTYLSLPGRPFEPIPSLDGCWIFVSIIGDGPTAESGIAVVHRQKGKAEVKRMLATKERLTGMTLTHDGRMLIAGSGDGVLFVDSDRLIAGDKNPIVGKMATSPEKPSASYLSTTSDDTFLFVSNESADTISVINLAIAKENHYASQAIIGNIATGRAPIAVTLSPDDRYLYTTSEVATHQGSGWPSTCSAEQASGGNGKLHAQGMVMVVDVKRAQTDPANAVVARVPAGCSPVRLVLSAEGDKAFVTARGDDTLLVFDTAKLLSDPAHSKVNSVTVGRSPVGVALIDSGHKAVVANSNRFSNDKQKQTLSVIDLTGDRPGLSGSIPAELFPREMRITADKRTLLLTNFASKTLEFIDLSSIEHTKLARP